MDMARAALLRAVLRPVMPERVTLANGSVQDIPADAIVTRIHHDGVDFCYVDDFLAMFGQAIPDQLQVTPKPPLYSALAAMDPYNDMGWREFFDEWRAKGIIA